MGDMIEMTTWPNHRNVFYKISSSGLLFEVKGASSAAIGLAKKPGNLCDFWVVLGYDQRTWIKKEGGGGSVVRTPNILNNGEYRRFWLTWRSGVIQLGQNHERKPIVTHSFNRIDLCYVTFSCGEEDIAENNPVHWRFELPPILEKPRKQSVTNGELVWVNAEKHLPDGALIGGYEDETLYIIRASHQGSLTPGKFMPSQGTAYVGWGEESHDKNIFEVLCGFDCTWVPSFDNNIPVGAVEGGYSENSLREKLYVGRALYCGHLIPGKVQPSFSACLIPYRGREIAVRKFEILVSSNINAHCVNRLLLEHLDVESPPESENGEDEIDERENDNLF